VDYAVLVSIVQACRGGSHDLESQLWADMHSGTEKFRDRHAVDELHNEIPDAILFAEVIEATDVWVDEIRDSPAFAY
jgi:hypothetical protein